MLSAVALLRWAKGAGAANRHITVGAGLPQIAVLAGDAKSYAERLFNFPAVGNLSPAAARNALTSFQGQIILMT